MDQRGQIRAELDEAVVSQVRCQPGEIVSVHTGLQPGQLRETTCFARSDKALVADECPDETHQDRRAFGAPRQKVGVPAC